MVSTQGRGFWILDDVGPLRQLSASPEAGPRLYTPGPADLFGGPPGAAGRGQNPPFGAIVYYDLPSEPGAKDEITLEFLDAGGHSIRKFSSRGEKPEEGAEISEGGEASAAVAKLPAKRGLNRFAWNLRHADAKRFKGLILWGRGLQGPRVPPGRHRVRLATSGRVLEDSFEVRKDPRVKVAPADDRARFDLLLKIRDTLTEIHEAITRLRDVRDQVKSVSERSAGVARDSSIARAARLLDARLTAVEETLYQTKNRSNQDPLNYPIRLNNKLSALVGVVEDTEGRPTEQSYEVFDDLSVRIDAQLATLQDLIDGDLAAFNQVVRDQQIPAVIVREDRKGKEEKREANR